MIRLLARPSILTFICLFLFLSCDEKSNQRQPQAESAANVEKSCMEKIIEEDNTLGTTRNHACEKTTLAETIVNYANALEQLDYGDCPKAFSQAFARHIQAWRDMIPLVEKYPDMRGEMHDLFDEIEKGKDAETFKPLLKAIWDTWAEIEDAMKRK